MRELGGMAEEVEQTIQKEAHAIVDTLKNLPTAEARTEKIKALTVSFKEYLKHGEDKVALAVQTYDMVDRHIRRLDDDLAKYEDGKFASKPNKPSTPQQETAPSNNAIKKDTKRVSAATSNPATSAAASNKGKNVANKAVVEIQPIPQLKGPPDDLPIDPNEPRYCICNQYSFGDMIGVILFLF
ncbi:UNVERIFIED_CONTAM: Inhibitor of growth protein 5 [Siphonaria sp. JEL0065]|nr:Inhibitor of growth protein 5 [Siphonaria sp. JEL0065]